MTTRKARPRSKTPPAPPPAPPPCPFSIGDRVEHCYLGVHLLQPWLNTDFHVSEVVSVSDYGLVGVRGIGFGCVNYCKPEELRAATDPVALPYRWIIYRDHGDAATRDEAAAAGRAAMAAQRSGWMVVVERAHPRSYVAVAAEETETELRRLWCLDTAH